MRKLTLDEKITIKGQLAKMKVSAKDLAALTMEVALYFWYRCYGSPLKYAFVQTHWHKTPIRSLPDQRR